MLFNLCFFVNNICHAAHKLFCLYFCNILQTLFYGISCWKTNPKPSPIPYLLPVIWRINRKPWGKLLCCGCLYSWPIYLLGIYCTKTNRNNCLWKFKKELLFWIRLFTHAQMIMHPTVSHTEGSLLSETNKYCTSTYSPSRSGRLRVIKFESLQLSTPLPLTWPHFLSTEKIISTIYTSLKRSYFKF